MCKAKRYKNTPNVRIDKCMVSLISFLEFNIDKGDKELKTYACCCGHGKYPMTIVVGDKWGNRWDIISLETIPRKRNIYKRDKQGYYYIPETLEK